LNAWENIDWAALSLGLDHTNEGHTDSGDERGTTAEACGSAAPDDPLYTFGSGYAFACTYNPDHSKLPLMPAWLGADVLVDI
jgi:hypothetical protein